MRSPIGPHKLDFAICKDCFWVVTVMNSELYRQSLCPVCSGIIDTIRFTNPNGTKILDCISAFRNMKYLYDKTDCGMGLGEISWTVFKQFI
jgi:hypothetical protein